MHTDRCGHTANRNVVQKRNKGKKLKYKSLFKI